MASIAKYTHPSFTRASPEPRGLQNPRSNLKTKLDRYKTALPTVAPSSGIVAWSSHGCSSGSGWPLAAVTWLTPYGFNDSIRQHQQQAGRQADRLDRPSDAVHSAFPWCNAAVAGSPSCPLPSPARLPDCPPTWFVPEDNPSPSSGVAAGKQRHVLRGRCHPQGPQHSRASLPSQKTSLSTWKH